MTPQSSTFLASHSDIRRTQISTSGCKSQNALMGARRPTGRAGLCTQLPPRLPTARRRRGRSSGPFPTATRCGPHRPTAHRSALFFTSERSQTLYGRVPKSSPPPALPPRVGSHGDRRPPPPHLRSHSPASPRRACALSHPRSFSHSAAHARHRPPLCRRRGPERQDGGALGSVTPWFSFGCCVRYPFTQEVFNKLVS